jgi:hypothetical protein
MLDTVAEYATDLIQRVVLAASVAEGVLLEAATDLVEDLGGQPDDMEGVVALSTRASGARMLGHHNRKGQASCQCHTLRWTAL